MPNHLLKPAVVEAVGTKPKLIEEFIGQINRHDTGVSVARRVSPAGWEGPGQRPAFREITLVVKGELCVDHASGVLDVQSGEAVITEPGKWIRYSTPDPAGAE